MHQPSTKEDIPNAIDKMPELMLDANIAESCAGGTIVSPSLSRRLDVRFLGPSGRKPSTELNTEFGRR
jgi:hypothetical protein